jgi:undecaprenyl-diphosphatase
MDFYLKVLVLALIQGAAELLPVSSSAHVILAAKLMKMPEMDKPPMLFMLIMLHTGTMFAAIVYFWSAWKALVFPPKGALLGAAEGATHLMGGATSWRVRLVLWALRYRFVLFVVLATAVTGVVGLGLQFLIEKVVLERLLGRQDAKVEELFKNLWLIGTALVLVGLLILASSIFDKAGPGGVLTPGVAVVIGLVQGLCLPFRGFSRSGATISTALVCGLPRKFAEEFSFALAVALTPAVIVRYAWKLFKSPEAADTHWFALLLPGLIGMVLAFLSGLAGLWLLARVLEGGRWAVFGVYCLAFAGVVFFAAWWGL